MVSRTLEASSQTCFKLIAPPAILGVVGGGQLGKMFTSAAANLGYEVWVLDPDPHAPAGLLASRHLIAAYDDQDALEEFARGCSAITTEFENVPATSLAFLESRTQVAPGSAAVAVAQDRSDEKAFIAALGIPVAPHAVITAAEQLEQIGDELFPGILKSARLGYDGKGQIRVNNRAELKKGYFELDHVKCVLEKKLDLSREISVLVARGGKGNTEIFPAAENIHTQGILDVSIVPARVSPELSSGAGQIAVKIANALGYVGVLAVEFFVLSDGTLVVNEIAPRPHNSGHYSLDGCLMSQFEAQVRAMCGLPFASAKLRSPCVMINILGDAWWYRQDTQRTRDASEPPVHPDWSQLLVEPQLRLHLYGKKEPRIGRKMGHITCVGDEPAELLAHSLALRSRLRAPLL